MFGPSALPPIGRHRVAEQVENFVHEKKIRD
jgi:hypothetical protein